MQKVSPRCCQAFGVHFFVCACPCLFFFLLSLPLHPASFMWLKCLVQPRPNQTRPSQTSCLFRLVAAAVVKLLSFSVICCRFWSLPSAPSPFFAFGKEPCFGQGSLHFRSVVIKKIMTPNCTRSGISLLVA